MPKFCKKPVVIEASQWYKNGDHPADYAADVEGFENDEPRTWSSEEAKAKGWEGQVVRYYRKPGDSGERHCEQCSNKMRAHGWIDTLEGGHVVCPGDWIITGVAGERYPCKPDIFEATYNAAADGEQEVHSHYNPPAFPHVFTDSFGDAMLFPGMSLRDWFAGQLAAAEVASAGANEFAAEALSDAAAQAGQTIEERIAFNAYRVADAMLALSYEAIKDRQS
ncbi:hypothetical protein [Sphingopyxis flava]|uniref:Uncharacterized protein n=1 Tax=Sphingopyxis flava TaxID=1507287 RepID=A0A1T5AD45_9SPHN|nr:hypothetical protein [Sphingopyxis flava]SKB32815.1 hypothetical protein SAMN06295937_1003113 [Sphingopyxis flava]